MILIERKAKNDEFLDVLWDLYSEHLQRFAGDEDKALMLLIADMYKMQREDRKASAEQLIETLGMAIRRMAPAEEVSSIWPN